MVEEQKTNKRKQKGGENLKKGSLEGRNKRRDRKEEIIYHEKSKKERETRRKCIEM
jgi:hypothetical protein